MSKVDELNQFLEVARGTQSGYLFRVEEVPVEGVPPLQPGSIIEPSGSYAISLNDGTKLSNQRKVEEALKTSCACPTNLDRTKNQFLFLELKDALRFSSKMHRGKSRIYLVTPNKVIGRYDMNILDLLNWALSNEWHEAECDNNCSEKNLDDICKWYWKKKGTFNPCWEFIVDYSTVIQMIADKNSCEIFHKEFKNLLSVERSTVFRDLIQRLP